MQVPKKFRFLYNFWFFDNNIICIFYLQFNAVVFLFVSIIQMPNLILIIRFGALNKKQ